MSAITPTAISDVHRSNSLAIDQLIEACRSYHQSSTQKDKASEFVEWIIQAANGIIKTSGEEIQAKFSVARIWGTDADITNVRVLLEMILQQKSSSITPIPQVVVESSARIGGYRIDVITSDYVGTTPGSSSVYPLQNGGCVIIRPCLPSRDVTLINRLNELIGVNAREVAEIMGECLNLPNRTINDVIPENQLIEFDIGCNTLHLWKGTNGILIKKFGNDQMLIGRLSQNCMNIIPDSQSSPLELKVLSTNVREDQSAKLSQYTINSRNHRRLVELVRANVKNPDNFIEVPTVAQYEVRTVILEEGEELTEDNDCTCVDLGYRNWLIIDPAIEDSDMLEKVVEYTTNNKGVSIKSLIKNVEEMLNA